MKYKKVALGGTFDRLHKGHERLIRKAIEVGQKVIVGLTVDGFSNKKDLSELILPYEQREMELNDLLKNLGNEKETRIVPLKDVFGPTLEDEEIEALVVTRQTVGGAKIINERRLGMGMGELPIIEAELVKDDRGDYLSSTAIRKGRVGRDGFCYEELFRSDISLSQNQRLELRAPQGDLIPSGELENLKKEINKPISKLAVVGDVATSLFVDNKLRYDVAFFDNKVQRKKTFLVKRQADQEKVVVFNSPGKITAEAAKIILSLEGKNNLIEVLGEEDLLVLPLIMLLPLESLVVYGQPNEGLVLMRVTEELKNKYYKFLKK